MSQAHHNNHTFSTPHIKPSPNQQTPPSSYPAYPSKQAWLTFFDMALLIIGVVALALSVLFFIAYNWLYMGKMAKFALVEGVLVINIMAYAFLVLKRQHHFIQQLLLLVASLITGGLLALFGQVYQTGADTWQLFFSWALLIIPWVLIARMPALWLLFLGLINASVTSYLPLSTWYGHSYDQNSMLEVSILAGINVFAFGLWLLCFDRNSTRRVGRVESNAIPSTGSLAYLPRLPLHWSSYVVAVISTFFISRVAVIGVIDDASVSLSMLAMACWLGWCVAIYLYFRHRHVDIFMLTCLCASVIAVILIEVGEHMDTSADILGLSVLFVLLIALSSTAMIWLRRVAHSLANTADRGAV